VCAGLAAAMPALPQGSPQGSQQSSAPAKAPPVVKPPCAIQPPNQSQWNATAQWLAGIDSSAFNAALTPDQRAAWTAYSKLTASDWSSLQKIYLNRIDAWRSKALAGTPNRDVGFYPFSGPDVANMLTFFPDAKEYLLIGLEPVGCVPTAVADYAPAYFTDLRTSLETVVASGFFRTEGMSHDLKETNVSGVLPLLLFLMSRSGFTIVDAKPIQIDATGALTASPTQPPGETQGLAIQFSDQRHGVRTLRYFSLNLENTRIRKKPGTLKYLNGLPETVTLVKSASYLMHKTYFSTTRNLVLSKSRVLVQDDSGVPFRYFDPQTWDVHLYGIYVPPIELFQNWEQDDLKTAFADPKNVQPLSFAIGYRHRLESNLLVGVRTK
jgi:hypothetical protein